MNASDAGGLVLVVRRRIAATPERLFRAWTDAAEFARWWGPAGVVCESAEIDARVGGAYGIVNRMPDGSAIWIGGEFETVEPPHRLAFTWRTAPDGPASRVVVSFEAAEAGTEVVVRHERIASTQAREGHERGWIGCLDGLAHFAE
jgi:uncharacterized protein YndB with AHSA1/START domain